MKFVDRFREKKLGNILLGFISFDIVGIMLAYWHGFGWFLFFLTLRQLIFSYPKLLVPFISIISRDEIVEVKAAMGLEDSERRTSIRSVLLVLVFSIGTALIFIYANIPIKTMISWLNS